MSVKEITDRIGDLEFHLIANRYDSTLPKEEKIGNVHVHRIGITTHNPGMADLRKLPLNLNKLLYQFLAAWHALRLHKRHRFDAMWAVMAHSTAVPAAIVKILHPEIGYVLNLQEGDPIPYIERKMRPLWPLFTRGFTKADIVQPLSRYLADWARARGFKGHIEIIPNAVNARHFSQKYAPEIVDAIKQKLGKQAGDTFLITSSRLVTKNAVDDVIRSLALLPQNVHFIVMGTGPDEIMLKQLAKDLGVEKRVQFLGQIGHDDMPKYLQASDIFIRPSRSEGMGASFPEAMAAELPIIATQEGGIADFLFDAKRNPDKPTTGWAVDRDAPTQIAEAVGEIVGNPERTAQVVKTAKELAFAKYDWDLIAADMRTKVFAKLV